MKSQARAIVTWLFYAHGPNKGSVCYSDLADTINEIFALIL
jgi:hypothetical protein